MLKFELDYTLSCIYSVCRAFAMCGTNFDAVLTLYALQKLNYTSAMRSTVLCHVCSAKCVQYLCLYSLQCQHGITD